MKKGKSFFDLSHTNDLTCGYDGKLVPIFCEPVIPGDVWKGNSNILARVTPLVQPIFGRFDIRTDAFFVPYRILWDNWKKFISPDENDLEEQPVFPCFKPGSSDLGEMVNVSHLNIGSLADHFGMGFDAATVGITDDSNVRLSSLPYRAYQLIWNEFYRDQDLQDEIDIKKTDGFTTAELSQFNYLYANWEKDYFTTSRPWAQKGGAASVPISLDGVTLKSTGSTPTDGAVTVKSGRLTTTAAPLDTLEIENSFSIEDLRYANSLQRWLERNARRGTRYIESLKSHFNVTVPDYKLQRPEFIGGGRQPLVISEVLQTNQAQTEEETPLGTYAGHGISSGSHNWNYTANEHGVIIVLMRIVPRVKYMNLLRKEWTKFDRFDMFWPDFAHLGEQSVKLHELNGLNCFVNKGDTTFGYQQRYAEYKFIPSTVHGYFRQDEILSNFTPARNIGKDAAVLTGDFLSVKSTGGYERVFAVQDYDPFLVSVNHNISALRLVPRNSTPGSHFI